MIEVSPTEDQQLQQQQQLLLLQQQQQQLTTRFAHTNIHQSFPAMEVRSLPAKRSILPEAPTSRRKATAADRKRASENSATTIIDVQQGFGNEFETEALPNALPRGKNNPLRCPYGLYAEQISGTMFITERKKQLRTWMYRVRPSACQGPLTPAPELSPLLTLPMHVTPERLRWNPVPIPHGAQIPMTFVRGMITMAGAGDPAEREGLAIYYYTANKSMLNSCFQNSDGDMLIVPETGTLLIRTELGVLLSAPGTIAVIPCGIKYAVELPSREGSFEVAGSARGYILEVFGAHFELPDLGPIGANSLASPRDFSYPVADFEDRPCANFEFINKFHGQIFKATLDHSPFDVVAWHGNYAPFTYNLDRFCPLGTTLFDHPDPSVFTVLTAKNINGVSVADFVIFPPRWAVQEDTFRPPYFHKNCMTEFMGVIRGSYEAKDRNAFRAGGCTLHPLMSGHGPDAVSYRETVDLAQVPQMPVRMPADSLAFMFETSKLLKLTTWAVDSENRDSSYYKCWQELPKRFDSSRP